MSKKPDWAAESLEKLMSDGVRILLVIQSIEREKRWTEPITYELVLNIQSMYTVHSLG